MEFPATQALFDDDIPSGDEGTARPKILVVDDDELVRSSLELVLGERYEVCLCASAEEAVAAVNDDTAAAILDVKMQGRDGFWACIQLRKRYPKLPVIFYSAYQDLRDPYSIINECRPFGYLVKDGNVDKLLGTVETAVRLYTIIQRNKRVADSIRKHREQFESVLSKSPLSRR